jgi:tol-pal system protein YbgF
MRAAKFAAFSLAALIAGSSLGVAVTHAQTPLPSEDPLSDRSIRRLDKMEKVLREMRAIVFQGRETGRPVVVQPAETDAQLQLMMQRVSDLEQTLTRLNEQNESLRYDLEQARRELGAAQSRMLQLTERLTPLEDAAAAQARAAQEEAARAAQDPDEAFAQAAGLINGGDFDGGEAALADFVARHAGHAKAAEANYMLGKAYAVRRAHAEAAAAYVEAIRGYPKTSWAPDAMAELARELIAMKRTSDACDTLAALTAKYPKAPAAVTKKAAAARTQAKCAA